MWKRVCCFLSPSLAQCCLVIHGLAHFHVLLPLCNAYANHHVDHLLSYFLGANEGTNDGIPESDIAVEQNANIQEHARAEPASIRPSSQPNSTANINSIAGSGGALMTQNYSLESFVHARARQSSEGLTSSASASSSVGLPPTPSVHFYDGHHHRQGGGAQPAAAMAAMPAHSAGYNSFVHPAAQQQQQHRRMSSSNSLQNNHRSGSAGSMPKIPSRASTTSTGSSSSSSLTSMAAALALGGPNQVMYMQQKLQSRDQVAGVQYQLNNTSPITPVNMMGSPSGHEMMMLPPPPRFPNGAAGGQAAMMHQQNAGMHHQNMGAGRQQHIVHQNQQQQPHQQPQQQPMVAGPQHSQNMYQLNTNASTAAQMQQPNFLPQMNPPAAAPAAHQAVQHTNYLGFPDPNSVAGTVLAQPQHQYRPQQQLQAQHQPQPQPVLSQQQIPHQQVIMAQAQQQQYHQQPQQQPQQIQIGLNGQTIPITAVPGADGSVYYQIDPSVVPTAGLRYFTKAINEVSKADEQKDIDPEVLAKKRQERLARNRESARQSRRRKKEHLSNMAAKVQKLQKKLEEEVRNKIRTMEGGLIRQRSIMLGNWEAERDEQNGSKEDQLQFGSVRESRNQLAVIIRKTGVNCPVRRAIAAHQYNFLRQALLSTHNHYSVWMMRQPSSFFTEAYRRHNIETTVASGGGGKGGVPGASKTISSRPNSKQMGEEIYEEERKAGKATVTCQPHEELKTWPLYCHEIVMTMEQEDRIVNQAHGQAKAIPDLERKLRKIKTATDATRHMQNAMLCHTQLASRRNETLLLDVLTPAQTALFLDWFGKNKDRCKRLTEQRRKLQASASAAGSEGGSSGEDTMSFVCRQLEEMRLQK